METKTSDFRDEMTEVDRNISRIVNQLAFKPRLKTKLYQSAFLFHQITAFKIYDSARRLIPFAYDDGHNLTEDGYITRYLGRKDPQAIDAVKKYRQKPASLTLSVSVDSKTTERFAARLNTIEDVRYPEINLNTDGDTISQLALDIVMFADLLNNVLTK